MVTAMISSPFFNAVASRLDFDFAPALRTSSGLIVATILPVPSICRIASCSCPSSTVRSVTTMTESKTFSLSTCSRASRCAVQAIVLVFPDPAECSIRYRCPTPSSATAATMSVTASHWWNRGNSMLVRRTEVPVATSHSSLVSTIISRPMMVSQASFSHTRSHRYAVADARPRRAGCPPRRRSRC